MDNKTDEQIHEMMGKCLFYDSYSAGGRKPVFPCEKIPPYSTDIAAAFEIWQWLMDKGYRCEAITSTNYMNFRIFAPDDLTWEPFTANADTLPMAICQAALKVQTFEGRVLLGTAGG